MGARDMKRDSVTPTAKSSCSFFCAFDRCGGVCNCTQFLRKLRILGELNTLLRRGLVAGLLEEHEVSSSDSEKLDSGTGSMNSHASSPRLFLREENVK